MALVPVAMTFGDGLRVTDSIGGCISHAYTVIGTAEEFLGPQFSLLLRFRLISTGSALAALIVGTSRFYINVDHESGEPILISLNLECNEAATITLHTALVAADTDEHSVAWTYDVDGQWHYYYDGALEETGTSPPCDISAPVDANERFVIHGSNVPGLEKFYLDEIGFSNGIWTPAQVADFHANGLS